MTDTNKKNHFVSLNARAEVNFFPHAFSPGNQTLTASLYTWNIETKAEGRLVGFFLDTQMMLF